MNGGLLLLGCTGRPLWTMGGVWEIDKRVPTFGLGLQDGLCVVRLSRETQTHSAIDMNSPSWTQPLAIDWLDVAHTDW